MFYVIMSREPLESATYLRKTNPGPIGMTFVTYNDPFSDLIYITARGHCLQGPSS